VGGRQGRRAEEREQEKEWSSRPPLRSLSPLVVFLSPHPPFLSHLVQVGAQLLSDDRAYVGQDLRVREEGECE
jgi:hypothetical protein